MTIRSSGRIGLNDIQNEFGGVEPIYISEYYRGGEYTTANNTNIPTSGQISGGSFYGASKYAPGYRIFYSSGSITLPSTSGNTLYYYVIAGGGGGGGGSSRIGYGYGAGGGGGTAGNSYGSISVIPGDTISVIVGGGGTAGAARDGPYSSGTWGGVGGYSQLSKNGTPITVANGGNGGAVAQYSYPPTSDATPGGSVGSILGASTIIQAGDAGQYGQNGIWWSVGGAGGRGFNLSWNGSAGTFSRGALGSGGIGYYNGYGSVRNAVSGGGYGAGGSGGGAMVNANASYFNGSSGKPGIAMVWW
jgi:hypothetical protein